MKLRTALSSAIIGISVMAYPASIQADSRPLPAQASPDAPAVVLEPTVARPDPSITWDPQNHVYRMYTTETWNGLAPEWQSKTVTGPWLYVGDALASLPDWHGQAFTTWAPEVQDVYGVWTLWGSTADVNGNFCLFRATASSAAGPFIVDPRRVPCDPAVNGEIDPSMVKIDGQWWLLDKTNGNGVGKPTTVYSQRIGEDGLPHGPAFAVLTSDQPWERGIIEAPNLIQSPSTGQWWLVFSAGTLAPSDETYRIAATPCDGPEGPCHIGSAVQLVKHNSQGAAPGEENAFVAMDGQVWIAYNPGGPIAFPFNRPLALVKLVFNHRGVPYVATP